MVSDTEYALMAGASYKSTRDPINQFPIPDGWTPARHENPPGGSGFEAISFGNATTLETSTEIVISYAGTYFPDSGDWAANFGLAFGTGSIQLTQAADYYLKIKAAAPAGAKITLTGHNLGGGLAALVGVFFGVEAHTFDQAPFAQSARWTENSYNVATALRQYLMDKTGLTGPEETARTEMLGRLDGFIAQRDAAGASGGIPNANLITNISVQGEVLDGSLSNYFRIGRTVQTLEHGETSLSGTDLHSIALLSAFKLNDSFRQVTYQLTDLLAMVFDKQLFAFDTDKSDPNLLEHLLRHQTGGIDGIPVGGNQMLDRFAADLGTLGATPGFAPSGNLTDALIAFAMQGYYSGPHAAEAGKQMLEAVSGGIYLDRADIAASLGDIKGYSRYFQNFLATLPETERTLIDQKLAGLLDWYLAGTQLNATAGTQTAFMLGAGATDNLTGGTQADLLVGLVGDDLLDGRGGDDVLVGGAGFDTYFYRIGDGADRIVDSDKQGRILVAAAAGDRFYNATHLIRDQDNPNLWISADGQVRMTQGGAWRLQIGAGGIDLGADFNDGDYGIRLKNALPQIAPTNTLLGDQNADKNDNLSGTAGSDRIEGLSGDDRLDGQGGDDLLLGGAGSDILEGRVGDDKLLLKSRMRSTEMIVAMFTCMGVP